MEELWAEIPNFSRYRISSYGRIYNTVFKRFMSPSLNEGHVKISLIDDDQVRRTLSVPVLVAQAFVERPYTNCSEVILLDGDLINTAAYNLAWRTPRQAWMYARQMRTQPRVPWVNLPVRNVDTGVVYENIVECGKVEGLLFEEIWESTKTAMGSEGSKTRVYPHGYTYEIVKKSTR